VGPLLYEGCTQGRQTLGTRARDTLLLPTHNCSPLQLPVALSLQLWILHCHSSDHEYMGMVLCACAALCHASLLPSVGAVPVQALRAFHLQCAHCLLRG